MNRTPEDLAQEVEQLRKANFSWSQYYNDVRQIATNLRSPDPATYTSGYCAGSRAVAQAILDVKVPTK